MVVNTTWSNPTTATGSGGLDFATGAQITETIMDRYASDIYRLGGTDGNAKTGPLYLGGTAFANAKMTQGLTIQQAGSDDEALALKSTDVAHGITSRAETDTYFRILKYDINAGGALIDGLSEATTGLEFSGTATTEDTTKSVSSTGAAQLGANLKSGTSITTLGANANLFVITNSGATKFIFDADGDSHQDVGTAWTNFDAYDDAALLNSLAAAISRRDDPIKAEFRQWVTYHREALEAARLVTFNDDGHHFINWSRTTMLLVGAVRQLAARLTAIEHRALPA